MKISLVVATGLNGEIGKDNKLLWHLPEDLKNFKKITDGHHILMGRKTFESLPKVLPKRTHIIVSRSKFLAPEGTFLVSSIEEGIELAREHQEKELFVIGGGQIYQAFINQKLIDKIYLTKVDYEGEADTFFFFPEKQFALTLDEAHSGFHFQIWERI